MEPQSYGAVLVDDGALVIDSERNEEATILRTSAEAIAWLNGVGQDTVVDQLWFDHDLGMLDETRDDTTIPFLSALEERCFFGTAPQVNMVLVHTSNRVGGDVIEKSMRRYFYTVRVFAGDYLVVSS